MPSINKVRYLGTDYDILKEELEAKAESDGYYEDMTVGDAEQLVASQYVEDSVPYNYRTTGGSADVGNREYVDGIVGGSIVWNQLVENGNFASASGWNDNGNVSLSVANNIATMTTTIASGDRNFSRNINKPAPTGHKLFVSVDMRVSEASTPQAGVYGVYARKSLSADTWETCLAVGNVTSTASLGYAVVYAGNMALGGTVDVKNFYAVDLTVMFGSTIADYIYSLEQATAGAGVAWFNKLFPNMDAEYSYHEDSFDEESPLITKKLRDYQPGVLLSIEGLASHNTVEFNQWDEEWVNGRWAGNNGVFNPAFTSYLASKNPIHVLPNTTYYFSIDSSIMSGREVVYYDASDNWISDAPSFYANATFTTPSNCHYVRFNLGSAYGNTYKNDICINLSWSGWRNGEYEAYQKHSYPLDDSLTLRGIPKLDAQNNLYYDGDEYLPDGTVNRRYAVVDLGMLTWIYFDFEGHRRFGSNLEPVNYAPPTSNKANAMCDRYEVFTNSEIFNNEKIGIAIHSDGTQIQVYDPTYTDVATFKAAMSGIMFIYELATPTTENAEPYQQIQICDDFGTEEYVSTSIVPVGHNTRYPANLRDKLQHLPDLADDDGYYMIGQSNKQMHLELFRIPKAPTSPDGTYVLKATVSGGTPTYTWEAQT